MNEFKFRIFDKKGWYTPQYLAVVLYLNVTGYDLESINSFLVEVYDASLIMDYGNECIEFPSEEQMTNFLLKFG